ncbi:tryptophan-rich sensory protein [Streptomyces virginiae]|uniref:tryptophan-rich sensory protein n=1 Tax=Streptomyces virginiae TaxID=1961 RepID=UPI003678E5FE
MRVRVQTNDDIADQLSKSRSIPTSGHPTILADGTDSRSGMGGTVGDLTQAPFFAARQYGLALLDILLLLAALSTTVVLFQRLSLPAALLLVPYLLWVAFATALNASIWHLNP